MESVKKRVEVDYLLLDRITSLPDSLIDCILACLSEDDFGDVVRTSVLSKRWRLCWTRVEKLSFDFDFLHKYVSPRGFNHVVSIIDSILSRHDGPLDHFSVYSNTSERKSRNFDVSSWMKVLFEKKIREISFYIVPPCLVNSLSCIFYCSTLKHLSLHCCDFAPSSEFHGFTNLVSLHLNAVAITAGLLETVISNSPLLRDLDLVEMCIVENAVVLINAPSLKTLFLGHSAKYCLKEYPNLIDACIAVEFEVSMIGHGRTCKLDCLAQAMPRVESLTLKVDALKALAVGHIPLKLPTILESLKRLKLDELDIFSVDHLSCAFCLIGDSPCLESLEIYVGRCSYHRRDLEAVESYCESLEKVGIVSGLSKLKFDNLLGAKCEVKVISAFLNCCPKAETVLFCSSEYIASESEEWLFEDLKKSLRPEAANIEFQSHPKYDEYAPYTSSDDDFF